MNRWRTCVLVAGLILSGTSAGWAQSAEDETAAIRKRVEAYVEAYNRRDAVALADLWSEDAVYVRLDTGERVQGRSSIAASFQKTFEEDQDSQLSVTIEAVRLVTPQVAIEDGVAELSAAGGESQRSSYTAVHVKKDDQWYLDSVRETETPAPPAAEATQLDDVAWLVGSWLDQDENSTVRTQWQWAKNKRFLVGSFSVEAGEQVELEGTQIIGWDPAQGQIRSWIFDSEGGFGEGRWRRAGNQWIVDYTSTLSDGASATSTNIYSVVDENTFTFQSVDRQIDGEPQEDVEAVPVHRQ